MLIFLNYFLFYSIEEKWGEAIDTWLDVDFFYSMWFIISSLSSHLKKDKLSLKSQPRHSRIFDSLTHLCETHHFLKKLILSAIIIISVSILMETTIHLRHHLFMLCIAMHHADVLRCSFGGKSWITIFMASKKLCFLFAWIEYEIYFMFLLSWPFAT